MADKFDCQKIARELLARIDNLPLRNTPNLRVIRKEYSRRYNHAKPKEIISLAKEIFKRRNYRWLAFELIRYHPGAIRHIGEAELREFGQDIDSWGAVDAFAGLLAGPAWLYGQVPDKLIHAWAYSEYRWWRRTALVCTVALNRRAAGGTGDVPRTLAICELLVADRDDMVVKAMSWALRELIPHDAVAVRKFLEVHNGVLAARIKREVSNKLTTGLKNPKRDAR